MVSTPTHIRGQALHSLALRNICLLAINLVCPWTLYGVVSQWLLITLAVLVTCRRHISLLRSLVADGCSSSIVPMHTVLEVYRVADLGLECVLPSADDEVNAACFHPIEVSWRLIRQWAAHRE